MAHRSVHIVGILWGPWIGGKLILAKSPRGLQVTSGVCMCLIIPYLTVKELAVIFKATYNTIKFWKRK